MGSSKFIVTTTINNITEATRRFANMANENEDWNLIIVGDKKTPHGEYIELAEQNKRVTYMTPIQQESEYKDLSDAIGWNKIMRRNLGFVEAYKMGAEIFASVDDDNIPYENWGQEILVNQEITLDCYEARNGVFDPLSITNERHMWHRGYPCELIPTRNDVIYRGRIKRTPLVQADLWDGVPDVDSMSRIIYNPRMKLDVTVPYCSTNIAPFNSQNTFLAREVMPYYMVLPHAGRMDDIWGAYILQKHFPDCVVFNKATVYQERHEPHARNMKDLKDETLGYEYTLKFIRGEFPLPDDSKRAYDIYVETMLNVK